MSRRSCVRRVNPDSGVMSEILLWSSSRSVRLFNPDRGVMSEMLLLLRNSRFRRVAYSNPDKSLIFAFDASSAFDAERLVKVDISACVIIVSGAALFAFIISRITARRLTSGICTSPSSDLAKTSVEGSAHTTNTSAMRIEIVSIQFRIIFLLFVICPIKNR